jgi:hypothetical protein
MYKAGLGLMALASIALATPAAAQTVYLDGRGVSVGVGERHHNRPRHHYRSHRGHDAYASDRCTTTRIVRSNGSVKTVRTCR